jgi:hypothetical protein
MTLCIASSRKDVTGARRMTARFVLFISALLLTGVLSARAVQTIRVYKIGSSSFPDELVINTKSLVEAAGDYTIVFDGASYTRLDQFVTQPYLFTQWTNQYLPIISAGNYDYVIFQTIGWFNLTPEQHALLLTNFIPVLVSNIQASGAAVVFYDKYVDVLRNEPDALARTWAGRYPEGVYLNYLLHVKACKDAGSDKVTFGGGAVHELWDVPHYSALGFLYNDSGHPGPMANYLSACDLARLLTGVVPTGNPVRAILMTGWQQQAFDDLRYGTAADQALYNANSNRVGGGYLTLTDAEAATLQQTAMQWHLGWDATLHSNLAHAAAFSFTTSEVARIYRQITNYAAYHLSQAAIDRLNAQFAEAEEGQLTATEIDKIRGDTKEYGADVRNYAGQFLTPNQVKQLQQDYIAYWSARNSKFRDDLYFEALCYYTLLQKGTNAAEVARMSEASSVNGNILWLASMKLLLERITPAQRETILGSYAWGGARKRYCPTFYSAQMAATGDWQRLIAVWERYFTVWDNPNLMDALKGTPEGVAPRATNCFPQSVWLEADRRFSNTPDQVALSAGGALNVPENGTNAFALTLTGPVSAGLTITVTVARVSASDCDIVVTGGAPCYFTSADWSTPHPVTLAARDDAGYTAGSALFHCSAPNVTALDVTAHELDDDNLAPAAPVNLAPADGALAQPLAPVLQASAFVDPNPGDTHSASQWQLGTNAAFSSGVWDSGSDSTHLTNLALASHAAGRRYYWRVRYRDAAGLWGTYSTATWFETDPALNNVPVATPDSYALDRDSVLNVAAPGVLSNDTDADGNALTAVKLSDPAHGALTLNANGSFSYTPVSNWSGNDSFTYCTSDGRTNSNITVCQLEVSGPPAHGGLICDYFEYGAAARLLAGATTADTFGWNADGWSGSSFPEYKTGASLRFRASGAEAVTYSNCLAGGLVHGSNVVGLVTRGLSNALDGTVWISLVVSTRWWNASVSGGVGNYGKVCINGVAGDGFGAGASSTSVKYRWLVYENGVITSNDVARPLGSYDTALLVAKLRTNHSGADDELSFWLFGEAGAYPSNLTVAGLGPPVYVSAAGQDVWGDAVTNLGLEIKSQNSTDRDFYLDSLRISIGGFSDDAHVYQVLTGLPIPEPAVLGIAAAAVLLAARRRGTADSAPTNVRKHSTVL